MNQLSPPGYLLYTAEMMFEAVILAAVTISSVGLTAPGDVAFQRGDFAVALSDYAAQVASNPSDATALLGLGTMELYRNDLADAKEHLMRAQRLDPKNPTIQRRLRTVNERETKPGEFRIALQGAQAIVPFVATDPLPLLRVKINGHDALLLLDTGAPAIGLTPDAAKRFGVASQAAGQGVFAGGKQAEVQKGRIDRVELPGVTVRDVPAAILPGDLELGGHHIDGALGTIFLEQFLSTIDYPLGRLILRPRSESSNFERSARAKGAAMESMWLVGDHFIFARARINGLPDALFNIDTGGAGLGVQLTKASLDAAAIVPNVSKTQDFVGGAGPVRGVPFSASSVSLGSFTQRNVPGLYFPDGDQFGIFPFSVAGTLSHEFFHKTALTFDFDAMQIVVDAGRQSK
ncbi:MAG TPA: aspartyl protease family protein [Candidatus Baltobacteraceae bacterium]|jgi:predicted aspartyl protease|nr:aspartyl protease family protein [Candidatus Baltobacteraceae bacterium]